MTNKAKESDTQKPDARKSPRGYSSISHAEDNDEGNWRHASDGDGLELCVVGDAADLEAIDEELLLENLKVEKNILALPSNH